MKSRKASLKSITIKITLLLNMEAVFVSSIKRDIIFNSKLGKRLGTTIDYQLDFDEHISRHCDSLFFANQEQRREIVKLFQVYNFGITL